MKIRPELFIVVLVAIAAGAVIFHQSRTQDADDTERSTEAITPVRDATGSLAPSLATPPSPADFTAEGSQNANWQQPTPSQSSSNSPALGRARLSGIAHTEALRKAQVSLNPQYSANEPARTQLANSQPAAAIQPENATGPTLEIPLGAILPAGFYEEAVLTPQQQAALDNILMQFYEDITVDVEGFSEMELWENARALADKRYKVLFGAKAFHDRHLAAAKEALKERRALNAASGSGQPATN